MTTTSTTSRHDPDLLRSEVSQARGRVAQLRKELRQARAEVASARRGVDTLTELVFLYNTKYTFDRIRKQYTDTYIPQAYTQSHKYSVTIVRRY